VRRRKSRERGRRPGRSTHIGVRRKNAINLDDYTRYIACGRSLREQADEGSPRDRRVLRKDEIIAGFDLKFAGTHAAAREARDFRRTCANRRRRGVRWASALCADWQKRGLAPRKT